MSITPFSPAFVEILESRIAPASLSNNQFVSAVFGSPLLLEAGTNHAGLSIGGKYAMFVDQGKALVFTNDLNANGLVEFNEISGIAAGDGLRLISFVDIYGDIVTNLKGDSTLTDSDGNASNNDPALKGDGLVVLPNLIERIEMRSLRASDLANPGELLNRTIDDSFYVSHSIFGSIYAGGGFGIQGAEDGLVVGLPADDFSGSFGAAIPYVESIRVGSAVSGEFYQFGKSGADPNTGLAISVGGKLQAFVPKTSQAGAGIFGYHLVDANGVATTSFTVSIGSGFFSGNGGFGASGGNIEDIFISKDLAGGYDVVSGRGGDGFNGGNGGSIVNFNDFGSITGPVNIVVGDGGRGLTGVGGNAGAFDIGQVDVFGSLRIVLGDGGDGFTQGGNGGGLKQLYFAPDQAGEAELPVPKEIVGSHRSIGGTSRVEGIDFNGDGFGDFVYLISGDVGGRSDSVVILGDGLGGELRRISLDAPFSPGALTVADFNGDGFVDVAVASDSDNALGGISVFMSRYIDVDGDGALDRFAGFENARNSFLPSVFSFGGTPIFDIAAGDFNGDGVMDIGVVANYFGLGFSTHVVVMLGESRVVESLNFEAPLAVVGPRDVTSGLFYADFGTVAVPLLPYLSVTLGDVGEISILEAAALSTSYAPGDLEYLFYGKKVEGTDGASVQVIGLDIGGNAVATEFSLGEVDTDREILSGNPPQPAVTLVKATLQDFTVGDFDGDGFTDIVALTGNKFLVALGGDGAGDFSTYQTGVGNQAGILLSGEDSIGLSGDAEFTNIVSVLGESGGGEVAIFAANKSSADVVALDVNLVGPPGGSPGTMSVGSVTGSYAGLAMLELDAEIQVFDAFRPDLSLPGDVYFVMGNPTSLEFEAGLQVFGPPAFGFKLTKDGYGIFAGDGGDSINGIGGKGGSIGSGLTTQTLSDGTVLTNVGSIYFQLAATDAGFDGGIIMDAGEGGNGFTRGGSGGDINGVFVKYAEDAEFYYAPVFVLSGDGGDSTKGAGGAGGDVLLTSIQAFRGINIDPQEFRVNGAVVHQGGDGGNGKTGGAGGQIDGFGLSDCEFNAQSTLIYTYSGNGGSGRLNGGAGGDIANFTTLVIPLLGEIHYVAGSGGDSVSKSGGAGGNIINSSPSNSSNSLTGEIDLQGGHGGLGQTGGAGGSIINFINESSVVLPADLISMSGGHGGTGVTKAGGAGGGVINVNANSIAANDFNKILAGNGGDSFGNVGGAGGVLDQVTISASSGGTLGAAGAGGNGLSGGGVGGSVTNSSMNAGNQVGGNKVVVIAGKGGDAYGSSVAAAGRVHLAAEAAGYGLGNINGFGGNGGSISNFTQPSAVSVRVDLIAGNGGSTINWGAITDSKVGVGRGGSISNSTIAGSIGNVLGGSPILTYGGAGFLTADFVAGIRDGSITSIGDSVGNVGLIAGAAGRIANDLANGNAVNGSVTNLSARNIMSMVAGSVDFLASIQKATGINVTIPTGDLGSDKPMFGMFDYLDGGGMAVSAPVLGGSLVDGAIIVKTVPTDENGNALTGTRVFVL